MSYRLEIIVYNSGREVVDNQGFKYFYSGFDDVGRTNNVEVLLAWLLQDLPDVELHPKGKTDWDKISSLTEEDIERAASSDSDAPLLTKEELAGFKRAIPIGGRN